MKYSLALLLHLLSISIATAETEIRVANDYLWRGFSQTQGFPNVQLEWTKDLPKGFYVDENISNVYFGKDETAFIEFTTTLGLSHEWKKGFSSDFSVSSTDYPDAQIYQYTEWHLLTTYKEISVLAEYAPHISGSAHHSYYVEFQYAHQCVNALTVKGTVGYWKINDAMEGGFGNTFNYSIGVSRTFGEIECELSWHNNPGTHPLFWANGSRVLLTFTKSLG